MPLILVIKATSIRMKRLHKIMVVHMFYSLMAVHAGHQMADEVDQFII